MPNITSITYKINRKVLSKLCICLHTLGYSVSRLLMTTLLFLTKCTVCGSVSDKFWVSRLLHSMLSSSFRKFQFQFPVYVFTSLSSKLPKNSPNVSCLNWSRPNFTSEFPDRKPSMHLPCLLNLWGKAPILKPTRLVVNTWCQFFFNFHIWIYCTFSDTV